ncbi:MAG TPA: MMPL family transporter, partial [Candidatus Dormibacteraeota bacterium]
MTRLLAVITERIATRRGALITLAAWALFAVLLTVVAQKNPAPPDAFAFSLPASAEARQADAAIAKNFPQSKGRTASIVLYRPGGLTAQDRIRAQSITGWLRSSAAPNNIAGVVDPLSMPEPAAVGLLSKDGSTLVIQALITDGGGTSLTDAVSAIRRHIGSRSDGLQIRVTGPAGILADLTLLTSKILGNILLGTLLLVLVILAFVYRAPLLVLLPVFAVVWSYQVATSLIAIGEHVKNAPINAEATAFVPILMFGAGTDYTLLILSRYRSALTVERNAQSALRRALRAVAEPILISGSVVFLATLTLTIGALPINHDVGVV